MGLNQAFDISVSGIKATSLQQEIIASNIANIDSTRTISGEPYRRKMVILGEKPLAFGAVLEKEKKKLASKFSGGVEVVDVMDDTSPFPKVYKPGHPDADPYGYVELPNVSLSKEMVDLVYNSRLHQANITAYNSTKEMAQSTLQLP
jgi:flagellar basal-body rod protein FlgC